MIKLNKEAFDFSLREKVAEKKVEKAVKKFEEFVDGFEAISKRDDLFERYGDSIVRLIEIGEKIGSKIQSEIEKRMAE